MVEAAQEATTLVVEACPTGPRSDCRASLLIAIPASTPSAYISLDYEAHHRYRQSARHALRARNGDALRRKKTGSGRAAENLEHSTNENPATGLHVPCPRPRTPVDSSAQKCFKSCTALQNQSTHISDGTSVSSPPEFVAHKAQAQLGQAKSQGRRARLRKRAADPTVLLSIHHQSSNRLVHGVPTSA